MLNRFRTYSRRAIISIVLLSPAEYRLALSQTSPGNANDCNPNVVQDYFPGATLSEHTKQTLEQELRTFCELPLPSLHERSGVISYRLIRRALVSKLPLLVIRVSIGSDAVGRVTVRGTYNDGKQLTPDEIQMSKEETESFLAVVDRSKFWESKSEDRSEEFPNKVDGGSWFIEGQKNSQYQILHRHNPQRGSVKEVGTYLIQHFVRG